MTYTKFNTHEELFEKLISGASNSTVFRGAFENTITTNKIEKLPPFTGCRLSVAISEDLHSTSLALFVKGSTWSCSDVHNVKFGKWHNAKLVFEPGRRTKIWNTHPILKFLKEGEKMLGYKLLCNIEGMSIRPTTEKDFIKECNRAQRVFNKFIIPLKADDRGFLVYLDDDGTQKVFPSWG